MRQRTRADWRVLVYQYWVRLEHETWSQLPDGVKQEEEAMRSLWNELVDVFAQRQATYQQLLSSLPNVADCQAKVQVLHQHAYQTAAALKAARRQLKRRTHPQLTPLEAANTHAHTAFRDAQAALQEARRAAAATMRPALRALHQSFFAATKHVVAHCAVTWPNREFLLGKFLITIDRFFKNKGGPPQRKVGEPRTVHFHHRFTSGGLPVAHLSGHSRRLHSGY